MKKGFRRALLCCVAAGSLLLAVADAAAAELGDLCWLTDKGTMLRFSITQSGAGHYTYTGLFDDGDGASYSIIGQVAATGNTILGSFNGSVSTASSFKTATFQVTFGPTLAGSAEGIRQKYDRVSGLTSTDYRTHTLTPTGCP
ncbi:MAG: hypothetical protein K8F27_15815 [Sulfuricellaceae bacterium]|nr:hypothetical protein [Sulfuricellaceae bacterium]